MGVSLPLYALVRVVLTPILRLWFRVRISGAEQIQPQGGAIIAAQSEGLLARTGRGGSTPLSRTRQLEAVGRAPVGNPNPGIVLRLPVV